MPRGTGQAALWGTGILILQQGCGHSTAGQMAGTELSDVDDSDCLKNIFKVFLNFVIFFFLFFFLPRGGQQPQPTLAHSGQC